MAETCNAERIFIEKGSYVKKGTNILKEKAFVSTLNTKFREERCDTCFKKCKIFRCTGCQYVYYCNRNCQRQAWPIHKIECPNFKRIYPSELPDAARMLAKIMIKLDQGGDQEKGYIYKNEYRTFKDLMSHYNNIQKDRKRLEHSVALSFVLRDFLPCSLLPEPREFFVIFGKFMINSFDILDKRLSVGVGLFLGASVIDHSCRPNAYAAFNSTTLIVSTIEDIPSFDWSKVKISYIENLNTIDNRRAELMSSYYFWCECKRCINPEPTATGALCPNKSCAQLCSPTEALCKSCGQELSKYFWKEVELITNMALRYLEKPDDPSLLDAYRMCLNKQEGLLHPLNIVHGRTLEKAFCIRLTSGLDEEALIWGRKLRKIYLYYLGEVHQMMDLLKTLDTLGQSNNLELIQMVMNNDSSINN